jgi:beta-glucosidase
MKLSRRSFGRLAGGAVIAAPFASPGVGQASAQDQNPRPQSPGSSLISPRSFPPGFLWGSATASYQVEGAVHEGGRGASIWDTFSHTPGKVANSDNGDVADDFYHRYRDDIALMKQFGLKTCRFSVAWSRIFPDGTGSPNQQGIDFYRRLADAMLEAGIVPYCTLYHWDLPQALQDKGGWENPDCPRWLAEYEGFTAGKLSPQVKNFMTVNELRIFTTLGYGEGTHAPGLRVNAKRLAQVCHHAVLGHGLSVQAIRAATPAGTQIGLADNAIVTVPAIETPDYIAAARRAMREENARFLTVIMEGRYTDAYLSRLGPDAPHFTPSELKAISSPIDFVGLNVYEGAYVRPDSNPLGYAVLPPPASYPTMYSTWLRITPEAIYWSPRLVTDLWGVKAIFITENGTSSKDVVAPDGHVYDTDRIMFLRNYFTQLQRAAAEGVPLRGYFLWSFLDNFEWADGYDKRFGIVYVDFKTQRRIPKLSATFYREVILKNAPC